MQMIINGACGECLVTSDLNRRREQ